MDLFDDDLLELLRAEDLPTIPPPPGEDPEREVFELTWEAFRDRRVLPLFRAAANAFHETGLAAGVRLENGSIELTVARESLSGVWSDRTERMLALYPRAGKLVFGSGITGWELESFDLAKLDEVVIVRKLRAFALAVRKTWPSTKEREETREPPPRVATAPSGPPGGERNEPRKPGWATNRRRILLQADDVLEIVDLETSTGGTPVASAVLLRGDEVLLTLLAASDWMKPRNRTKTHV